jgi:hypothetical protein
MLVSALEIGGYEVSVSHDRHGRTLKIVEAVAAGRTNKRPNIVPERIDFQL